MRLIDTMTCSCFPVRGCSPHAQQRSLKPRDTDVAVICTFCRSSILFTQLVLFIRCSFSSFSTICLNLFMDWSKQNVLMCNDILQGSLTFDWLHQEFDRLIRCKKSKTIVDWYSEKIFCNTKINHSDHVYWNTALSKWLFHKRGQTRIDQKA